MILSFDFHEYLSISLKEENHFFQVSYMLIPHMYHIIKLWMWLSCVSYFEGICGNIQQAFSIIDLNSPPYSLEEHVGLTFRYVLV
jgi:hypothetical protein